MRSFVQRASVLLLLAWPLGGQAQDSAAPDAEAAEPAQAEPSPTPEPEAEEDTPGDLALKRLAAAEDLLEEGRRRDARILIEEALGTLDVVIASREGTTAHFLGASRAARLLGEPAAAIRYSEAILAAAPGDPDALREAANAYYQLAELPAAEIHAEELAKATNDPNDWILLADIRDAAGDGLAAIEACSNAVELDPGDSAVGRRLVALLDRHGEDVEGALSRLVAQYPDNWLFRMLYGDELRRIGMREQAADFYEQAHQLAPDEPEPLLRLIPESHTEKRRERLPELTRQLAEMREGANHPALQQQIYMLDEFDYTDHLVRVFSNYDASSVGSSKYVFIVSEHPDFPDKGRRLPSVRVLLRSDGEEATEPAARPYDLVAAIGDAQFLIGAWDEEPAYAAVREQVEKFLLGDDSVPIIPLDSEDALRLKGGDAPEDELEE